MDKDRIVLGYWNVRGRAQVLRHLLAYCEANWEDKVYSDPLQWFGPGDKAKLGLDFPDLPYLVCGDLRLTEPRAIVRYIVRKSGHGELLGKTAEDEAKVEMVLSVLDEIYNPTHSLFFSADHEKVSPRIFEGKVQPKLKELNALIGGKPFVLGYLTVADFQIAESVAYFRKMYGQALDEFENFLKVAAAVEGLPKVQAYYQRDNAVKGPYLQSTAKLQF